MLKITKMKLLFVLSICVLGIYYIIPNFYDKTEVTGLPNYVSKKQVNLGLDLQGGSHLLLEVDTNAVLKEKSEYLVDDIRSTLRKNKIKYTNLGSKVKGAVVTITDPKKTTDAVSFLRKGIETGIVVTSKDNKLNLSFTDQYIIDTNNQTVEQSIEVIRKRVDESGTKEPIIQKQGADRIIVQLPGIKDPERVKSLIGRTAKLNFHLLDPTTVELALQRGKLPQVPLRSLTLTLLLMKKNLL